MKKTLVMTCLFLGISICTLAQRVSVNAVKERRSTSDGAFDNKCEIELKVSGDEVRKYKFLKVLKINKVVDDQELDLLKEDENDFEYKEIEEDATVEIETKIPARKATVIKEISGELSLYNPTEANGAVVKIPNYQSKTNINLLPATAGVQVAYMTKASIEKYLTEQKQKKEEELKKLPEFARKMAEGLMKAFEGMSSDIDEPNQAFFFIEGDESKLVELYFEDASGKKIERNSRYQRSNLVAYSFDEKPNPSWKLVLNIETAASTKKVAFKLIDVALP